MNCHGFSSGVTLALLHRFLVDDPISGQDGMPQATTGNILTTGASGGRRNRRT
jgi:hypothetical protein